MHPELWVSIGTTAISTLVGTGAIGYALKAAVRLEVLERLFAEKKVTIDTVKTGQDSMDKRLSRVEDAIAGLNDVLPELRKLSLFTEKLDIVLSMGDKRIERIEQAVFGDDQQ